MDNKVISKSKKSCKVAFPFKIEIDPMERLIVASIKGDPEFDMIEPQLFDDPINGKGMRIILYRKDKKVDIYWQAGVNVNKETITIGAGIEHFEETVIKPSKFEITENGVNLHVLFTDAQDRTVELKIKENSTQINPFPFLAPVGKDIDNPKRLFLAHMLEFDFVRKKGTKFFCKIGDRILDPESFPIPRNYKKAFFTRYSGCPVVGTFNPPMEKPLTFELEVPGSIKVDSMEFHVDGDCRIRKVCAGKKMKNIEWEFPDGFPNLYDIKDDSEIKGKWVYRIAGMLITGGTYYLFRANNIIEIKIDVIQNWKPTNLPLSFKLFTWVVSSFRTWPTTYVWNGLVNLNSNTMNGNWQRKNQDHCHNGKLDNNKQGVPQKKLSQAITKK